MTSKLKRKAERKLKPTDPDFVAPDGGWGWLVVFACGLSDLSMSSMYYEFGLVFIDKFQEIGITHVQTTIIINIHMAFTLFVGLLNGPIFKRFSFRQVSLFGSTLVVCSLLMVTRCNSFWSYFLFYGILYGSSVGLTQSANVLALNTYFKKKRNIATGLSWGITGIGPIIWPYVITVLMKYYEMEGTLLLFAGFATHAIMCSLLLQPVYWHTKCREEAEVPLMSLYSIPRIVRSRSLPSFRNILDEIVINGEPIGSSSKSINVKTDHITIWSKYIQLKTNGTQNACHKSEPNITRNGNFTSDTFTRISPDFHIRKTVDSKPKLSFSKKIITFFDLDILKDFVYLHIMFGMISVCFVEFNLAFLTPAILKEFNFENFQIATYLSLLEVTDILVRFCFPFLTRKIKCNNRVYFLFGSLNAILGRIVLIHTQQFYVSLLAAVIIGCGKGLFIVYLALLIPNHVPLLKLPAALGIYYASFGFVFILMAPVTGWIRYITQSYVTTIHILHIFIYIAAFSWLLEYLLCKKQRLQVKFNKC